MVESTPRPRGEDYETEYEFRSAWREWCDVQRKRWYAIAAQYPIPAPSRDAFGSEEEFMASWYEWSAARRSVLGPKYPIPRPDFNDYESASNCSSDGMKLFHERFRALHPSPASSTKSEPSMPGPTI